MKLGLCPTLRGRVLKSISWISPFFGSSGSWPVGSMVNKRSSGQGSQPAKKAKAKAKASSGAPDDAAVVAAATQAGGLAPVTSSANAGVLQAHLDCVQSYHAAAVSGKAELLTPPKRCFVQPFEEKAAVASLKRDGKYLCAINLAWLNPTYNPLPQMPLNKGAIKHIRQHWFSAPASFDSQKLVVAVLRAEVEAEKLPAFGLWRTMSPVESLIAWYEGAAETARVVSEQGDDPDNVLDAWLEHLLTAPATLQMVDSEQDLMWKAQQWKEDTSALGVLACTAIQRVFDIQHRRAMLGEHFSPERVVEEYNKNLTLSVKSDAIKVGLVNHCTAIFDRLLCHQRVLDLMLQEDGENPEPSIFACNAQLHALAAKVGSMTVDEKYWVVALMIDQRRAGILDPSSATSRFLQGTTAERNKGYIDLLILKMRIKNHLLGVFFEGAGKAVNADHKSCLRQVFSSPEEYRKKFGFPQKPEEDLSWKAGWPASSDLLVRVMQDRLQHENITPFVTLTGKSAKT